MTRRRLHWLLQTRGTDLSVWPDADRRAAFALLRRNNVARQLYADVLAGEEPPEPDALALDRMQVTLRHSLAPLPAILRGMGWSALAACVGAGLYLGMGITEPDTGTVDLFTQAQTVSFASLDQ